MQRNSLAVGKDDYYAIAANSVTPGPEQISFRPLAEADLPLMHKWLNCPHVLQRYGGRTLTLEQVATKYGRYISGAMPVSAYVIAHNANAIGYIQAYRVVDNSLSGSGGKAQSYAGLDFFIGEQDFLNHGLGSAALREFLKLHVFSDNEIYWCLVDPAPDNTAAIKACEKAGFQLWKITVQSDTGEVIGPWVMRVRRDA